MQRRATVTLITLLAILLVGTTALGRRPIRNAFFNVYPGAAGTQIDDLPSNADHCGICHFDFDGGGPRNPYGATVEVARNSGMYASDEEAIQSVEGLDQDNDGYISLTEITSMAFSNTPTFPGLTINDTSAVLNVAIGDIIPYVTPSGATDTIPPAVAVVVPAGGEMWDANTTHEIQWIATDPNDIDRVDIHMSDDGGVTFKPIARAEANDSTFDWFVPNRPGGNTIIRVLARDGAGNWGSAWSAGTMTINGTPAGLVPTTLRDIDLPGSQPLTGTVLEDPDVNCITCHANFDTAVEPYFQWKGSMMAQAMRDPLFLACLAVAEQDAPSVGDLCLRCHTPGGWLEGRSVDTGGGLVNAKDREGVQCDFCHRLVDPNYVMGVSPSQDEAVLDSLVAVPLHPANGQFVTDPNPAKRGPYSDAQASHAFLQSPFHMEDACGTCHDVSNPVFTAGITPGEYNPTAFDTEHPDGDLRNMFPIERTFSEWSASAYANGGVFAPQFAGDKPDGIVSTCQDCHMRDVTGKGCNEPGAPTRTDIGVHDLTGGNYLIPDMVAAMYPAEVDTARLNAGKQRAIGMLQLAATLALAPGQTGNQPTVTVTVTNETGHKLPSGYPEGRRIWINLKAWDASNNLVYESGAYDAGTGVLTKDADIKVYQIKPGISERLSPIIGLPAGESFHFVVNDTVYHDNRIPPRGYTHAAFEAIQSPPVAYSYPDSQYWDETEYLLPPNAVFAEATLYYQTTTKEYVEFLKNENVTNSAGDDLYNAWVNTGRGAPVAMASDTTSLMLDPTGIEDTPSLARTALYPNTPNPFNPVTTIHYSLSERQRVTIAVYDVRGALVRTLVDDVRPAGNQSVDWRGENAVGGPVASGIYFIRMTTKEYMQVQKAVLLK